MAYSEIQIKNKLKRIINHLELEQAALNEDFEKFRHQLISAVNAADSYNNGDVEDNDTQDKTDTKNQIPKWLPDTVPKDINIYLFGSEYSTDGSNLVVCRAAAAELQKSALKVSNITKELATFKLHLRVSNNLDDVITDYIMNYKLPQTESLFRRVIKWVSAVIASIVNYITQENPDPKSIKSQIKATVFTTSKRKPSLPKERSLPESKYMGWSMTNMTGSNTKETKSLQEQLIERRFSISSDVKKLKLSM